MATRYAVATGNWSNTATWDGGTLPTAADDVYANARIVTIDGTFTVLSIRNFALGSPVIAAGGQFIYANGGNLTCTAALGIISNAANSPPLEMTLISPNVGTFNGSVLTLPNNGPTIRNSGSGTLNLNGNYNLDGQAFTVRRLIELSSSGVINIVGNVSSTAFNTGPVNNTVYITNIGTLNVTGNVSGGASGVVNSTINSTTASNINITGNLLGNAAGAVTLSGAGTLTVIGNVTTNSTIQAISVAAGATVNLLGIITGGNSAPAVSGGVTTFVKIRGNVVNTDTFYAIYAGRVTIDNNVTSWQFKDSTNTITRTLYTAGVALGNPAVTNVRLGTTYGASGELTGTLAMPIPATVLLGVLTDATTGTLLMTPADFWNYLISSGFTTNSIGDRLQNAATVATTGNQIASYNI